jgi:hypothetical protein
MPASVTDGGEHEAGAVEDSVGLQWAHRHNDWFFGGSA